MTPGRCRGGPRGLVLHQGGWDRCGPRAATGWIPTAARGVSLQGVVIKYWGSVVTAATGIQVDWYTGVLQHLGFFYFTLYFLLS